jgi:hypothetical protein
MKSLLKKICLCSMGIFLSAQITTFTPVSAVDTTATTAPVITGNSYYVATDGSDSNPGTLEQPFASLMKAQEAASSGDTVFIRGGVYSKFTVPADTDKNYNYWNDFAKSGITYRGYASEVPIFNFSNVPTDKRAAAFYVDPNASDITFQQFEVVEVPVGTTQRQAEGFQVRGKNITLNQINVHDTQAVGIYYTGHSTGTVYRCDSYNNIGLKNTDKNLESIGNCDGFGAHGDGVKFIECRSWNNSDDGYDCINSWGSNTFESCWAFSMNAGGDSNGFKISGWGTHAITFTPPVHTVTNCIAAGNDSHGFYSNHQPGQAAKWTNNTAYNNKKGNFYMNETDSDSYITNDPEKKEVLDNRLSDIPGTREVLHYNLAYKNNTLDFANLPDENNTDNSWNLAGVTMTDADFQSLDMSQLSQPRGVDGSLPAITFMKPADPNKFSGLGRIYQ